MDNSIEIKEIKEEINKLIEHQLLLKKYFKGLRDSTDYWVRTINKDVTDLYDLPSIMDEHTDNIQHNYELVYELKDEIEELKKDINAIKLIQIITLKQKIVEKEQFATHKDESLAV